MFAIDTNIFVYAHNISSPLNQKAKNFLDRAITDISHNVIGIPLQVCSEFINVCTKQNIGTHLSISEAIKILRKYTDYLEISVIYPMSTQLETFLNLCESVTTRKKVFDVVLAATLKDNQVEGLYTVNVDDFKEFTFLKVENPLL